MEIIGIEAAVFLYYFIDFAVILFILAGLRWFAGLIANASIHAVLSEHDNFAVGISLAGAIVGIAIMSMGAVSGEAQTTPRQELILIATYGALGVALMGLTREVFDYLVLPEISIHRQILKDNRAAGLVDASNMIATAIIVRAVMLWVEHTGWESLGLVFAGFAATQLILYLAAAYRKLVFARRHPGRALHEEIKVGNMALAVRFAGHRIGVALAVSGASGLIVFHADTPWWSLGAWLTAAIGLFLVQILLAVAARHVLLPGIDIGAEVTEQRNVAIGSLEAAIYIAMGLILLGLLG